MERFIVVVQCSVSDETLFSWVDVGEITYQLILVGSSAYVLEVATTFKPDLFLIEHNTPALDGVVLCHELHALPGQEEIPTMVVSYDAAFPTDCSSIDVPYVSYIEEPFDLIRLLDQAERIGIMAAS